MTDVETRLRDALAARADTVTHEPDAYAAVAARRSRRNANRLRALAASAATVAAVAATVVVARPAPEQPPAAPATTAPALAAPAPSAWITVVDGEHAIWERGFADPPNYTFVHSGFRTTAVAAFGDSRRFVYASLSGSGCVSHLSRATPTRVAEGINAEDIAGGDIAGAVTAIAVSPDARRLAYLMHPADRTGDCARNVVELRVRDLRTGREQAWREPAVPPPDRALMVAQLASVSWSADGRYVSPGGAFEVVDTTASDRALRWVDEPILVGDEWCTLQDRTFRGRTGEVVGYVLCSGTPHTGVHVLDGNRPVRLLIPAPSDAHYVNSGVRFDRSGDHAFLLLGDQSGRDLLYRWNADTGLREVDTGDEIEDIAW